MVCKTGSALLHEIALTLTLYFTTLKDAGTTELEYEVEVDMEEHDDSSDYDFDAENDAENVAEPAKAGCRKKPQRKRRNVLPETSDNICEVCQRQLKNAQCLAAHMRTHTGERYNKALKILLYSLSCCE